MAQRGSLAGVADTQATPKSTPVKSAATRTAAGNSAAAKVDPSAVRAEAAEHETASVGKTTTAAEAERPRAGGRASASTVPAGPARRVAPAQGGKAVSGEAVGVGAEVAKPDGQGGAATAGAAAGPQVLPVREGESPWSEVEVDAVREELRRELTRMEREAASLQTNIDDVLRDTGGGVGDDQADSGAKAFEREQEMTLLATVRGSQLQTERALQRIADGTYGFCESCGSAIGKARLQAYPRATLCVTCKQKQERR